jgi:hypothetical protein
MTLTVNLAPESVDALYELAGRTGQDLDSTVAVLLREQLQRHVPPDAPTSCCSPAETHLLQQLQHGLPEEIWQRYHELVARRETEELTDTEQAELLRLADAVEGWNVRRLELAVDNLLTWGTTWSDYNAPPPTPTTVGRAQQWITDLYHEVLDGGRTWDDPLITANEQGEAMFEWQHGERRLTIYVTETETNYSKTWGTPPDFEFEDGIAVTPETRESLWVWLGGC